MNSRHRRAPSALPLIGLDDLYESPTSEYMTSQPLPKFSSSTKDSSLLKQSLKPLNGKFSYNTPSGQNNEFFKYDNSSNESSLKGSVQRTEICERIEILSEVENDDPLDELSSAIDLIVRRRENAKNKALINKKSVKAQLGLMFKLELSDVDTDRRRDNNKNTEETIEGPGSSFNVDDLSLVKFDASIEHVKRRKGKTVKFKD
jgi:hypothetical protein